MNRTKFIETSGAAAGAAALGSVKTSFNENQSVSEPPQGKKSKIKLGLYSISYGGIWYEGPALSFKDFCKRAKDYGFDGVELDNKRPMGCPLDLDKDYVANAVRTVGNLQVHSHFGGEYYRDKNGSIKPVILDYYAGGINHDYQHFIGLMNEIGYNGYFTFELCHPILN